MQGEIQQLTESLVGEVIDGKYLVEKQLGKGGMGKVYLATHLGTDRPVALKVIVPQFMAQEEFVERFKREAKAAGRLRHPNVVDVTDFGFALVGSDQIAYLVMEYLDGCSLADILAEESKLPIAWVADIIEQVCAALAGAHKRGIVHRDLKPDNIWLEPNRRGGYTVKVLDFGLAKLSAEGRPGAGAEPPSAGGHSPGLQDGRKTSIDHRNTHVVNTQAHPGLSTVAEGGVLTRHQSATADEEGATQILGPPGQLQTPGLDKTDREASTILMRDGSGDQASKDGGDDATRILTNAASLGEGLASIQHGSSHVSADGGTQILPAPTGTQHQILATQVDDGLTRVGSVMGTPVYMSPEQCRGDEIDFRSDIYSIGVIAYQMLAGRPPFVGMPLDVINQHIGAAPTPVRTFRKEIPRAMARTVMAALSKDASKRPASAAALASSLRASLDVTGALFRRGMALYSELFPKLFKVSVLANLPVVVLAVISVVRHSVDYHTAFHGSKISVEVGSGAGDGLLTFLASTLVMGVTIRVITQIYVAPLRPVNLKPAFVAVKRRVWALLWTDFLVLIISITGLILGVIPGLIFYIGASLRTPVIMTEDLKGWKAIRRSLRLVNRSRLTVIAILIIQYLIPTLAGSLAFLIISSRFKGGMNQNQADLIGTLTELIARLFNVLIVPFIATLNTLLYIKVRMTGGELLDDMLSSFTAEDVPTTRWQMRMRSSTTGA